MHGTEPHTLDIPRTLQLVRFAVQPPGRVTTVTPHLGLTIIQPAPGLKQLSIVLDAAQWGQVASEIRGIYGNLWA